VGQLLVPDSFMTHGVTQMNPRIQSFIGMFTSWLQDHPEISVGATQNVLFYFFSMFLMPFSLFALGRALPVFITRDLASNAIVIYSTKAVTRGDYLLGKFCAAFGLLSLTWLGPVCAAWFMGNLLGPNWNYFWHARAVLFHALIFGLSSMVILSLLALGVSAVSSRVKWTIALWYIWWALGRAIQPIAFSTQPWLRHVSIGYNLEQIALATFGLGRNLQTAQDNIPIFGQMLQNVPVATRAALDHPTLGGAIVGLALMVLGLGLIVRKRVAPE
jgi:hypothetical protein